MVLSKEFIGRKDSEHYNLPEAHVNLASEF
jgi:hypothetical protein